MEPDQKTCEDHCDDIGYFIKKRPAQRSEEQL